MISIIGLGYVGLTQLVGFALKGYDVIGIDQNEGVVANINQGRCTIYDKGLLAAFSQVKTNATTEYEAILNSDITFICVGTPAKANGENDLDQVEYATEKLGRTLRQKKGYHLVVVKCTVIPGTTEDRIIPLLEKYSGRTVGQHIGVCMSPEFLSEGRLLEDFMNPDRIIIGEHSKEAGDILSDLYQGFNSPIVRVSLKSAEMIKYAANAFLATKVSFMNEIGNICKRLGIDVYEVARGIGYDSRIGSKFLEAGIGFGGSCLPKDLKALIAKAIELDYDATLLKTIIDVNRRQALSIVNILEQRIGSLKGKRVAVLGLAFKRETDDVRDSQAIPVIEKLLEIGARVSAYDPKAMGNMKKVINDIEYQESARDALEGADACLVMTDWEEFKHLDKEFDAMKKRVIIEGRRVIESCVEHEGVCW